MAALAVMLATAGAGAVNEVTWTVTTVSGEPTEYTAAIKYPYNFSNSTSVWYQATSHPDWYPYFGWLLQSWSISPQYASYTSITPWTPVFDPTALHTHFTAYCPSKCETETDNYIFSSTITRNTTSDWYAVWHVGTVDRDNPANTFPPTATSTTGTPPGWATSSDGLNWHYHGKLTIESAFNPSTVNASNAAAFVTRSGTPSLDHDHPGANRFLSYENHVHDEDMDGAYDVTLALLYSADGDDWYWARGTDGRIAELLPSDLAGDSFDYATAAIVDGGKFHILATADLNSNLAIRHIYSCNGLTWRTLETDASELAASGYGPWHIGMLYASNKLYAYNGNIQGKYTGPSSHSCP